MLMTTATTINDINNLIKEFAPSLVAEKVVPVDELHNFFVNDASYNYDKCRQHIQLLFENINVDIYGTDSYKSITVIENLHTKTNEHVADIPGIHMLTNEEQQKHIRKLLFIKCQKYISQDASYNNEQYDNDLAECYAAINDAIDCAAETYTIPDQHLDNIKQYQDNNTWSAILFSRITLTPFEKLIKQYQNELNEIIGINMLSKDEYNKFLNKLIVLQERIINKHRCFVAQPQEQQALQEWHRQVAEIITAKATDQVQQEYNKIADTIGAYLIENQELRSQLKEKLLLAMVEQLKHNSINNNAKHELKMDVIDVCSEIVIAKYLSNIYAFNQMSNLHQQEQINNLLNMIKKQRSLMAQKDKKQFNIEVSRIIDDMMIQDSDVYKNVIANLGLGNPHNAGILNNIIDKLWVFMRTPSIRAALKAGAVTVVAANATPLIPAAGHDNNPSTAISLKTSVLATCVGMILGYNYSQKINNIFPIEYLIEEIADIYNNYEQKSTLDRLIRSIPIGTAISASLWYIPIILATNPVSIPLLAVIGLGSFISVPLLAIFSKLANKISGKIHDVFFDGATNPDYYDLTLNGKRILGDDPGQIEKVVSFFKKYIPLLERSLHDIKHSTNVNEFDMVLLQDNIQVIKKAFESLKKGEHTKDGSKHFDDAISFLIAYQKSLAIANIKAISTEEIVDNIVQLSESSESIILGNDGLSQQPRLQNLKEKNTDILTRLDEDMKQIQEIYYIVKPTKSADNVHLLDVATQSAATNDIATSSNLSKMISFRDKQTRPLIRRESEGDEPMPSFVRIAR